MSRINLPALIALALVAGCNEQKQPAPEAQKQAQNTPQQAIEAAKPVVELARPAEARPAEARPAEARPAEARPAEARPAEDKPAEARPAEARPAKVKPVDTTTNLNPEAATEPYVLPELEKVALPDFNYPKFSGKKMSIVFTGNVVGELEPGG